ncbi:uncharacterized protein EDB93DRAFT_1242573 [Suillus bovinus]|uniref:uncharacterized protein n=1 Tax=Suillus bovinus TaxID=48563 RepID=UPI001B875875|nr:uncharacterized protein EDB93DRAFT_1242573 [Suillus bovinus]KAG2135183.1 hypothetical protein EDB93DRAFT_1242573 [Suillus bovinus]
MTHFRVFLGAPSASNLKKDSIGSPSQILLYPPATLEAASRRISLFYQNIIFDDYEQTTVITWPPTPVADTTGVPSFLRISQSQSQSQLAAMDQTQETTSVSYSDASSIARFPHFQINLHKGRKVNILLATLEVEGPDTVRVKKGPDAGKEVSVLKMILGDEDGSVCKLTAWRGRCRCLGCIGHLAPTCEPGSSITLTASPYNKPTAEICFRTMPYTREDNRLRPDLRLGKSDAAVKKVAALAHWFEQMAGLVVS